MLDKSVTIKMRKDIVEDLEYLAEQADMNKSELIRYAVYELINTVNNDRTKRAIFKDMGKWLVRGKDNYVKMGGMDD